MENNQNASGKRLLRVNNVVRRIGVSERTIRYWASKGQLKAYRLGEKIWAFDPDKVEEFMQQRRDDEAAI